MQILLLFVFVFVWQVAAAPIEQHYRNFCNYIECRSTITIGICFPSRAPIQLGKCHVKLILF